MPEERAASLSDVVMQLRINNRLLAASLRDKMKMTELIFLLQSTGASNREIADTVNATPDTVRSIINQRKRSERAAAGSVAETPRGAEETVNA